MASAVVASSFGVMWTVPIGAAPEVSLAAPVKHPNQASRRSMYATSFQNSKKRASAMAKYCPTAKDDTIEKLEASNVRLRAALVRFVEHFGPLEDNHMLHEDARACFRLARAALGPEQHALAIQAGLTQAR